MTLSRTISAALLFLAAACVPASAEDGWITVTSANSAEVAKDKLVAAIEQSPASLFAVMDHRKNAQSVGLDLAPIYLVMFGNPKVGTPIMQADPRAGHDLPVRVLVWEQDGKTMLSALAPLAYSSRYDVNGAVDALGKMENAVRTLMDKAAE